MAVVFMLCLVLVSALVTYALATHSTPAYPTPSNSTPAYSTPAYPTPAYPTPSYSQPSYSQYPQFSEQELRKAVEFAHRVAAEKDFAIRSAGTVRDQKAELLKRLNHISYVIIPSIRGKAKEQRADLDYVLENLSNKYRHLVEVESVAAGQSAIGALNKDDVHGLWPNLYAQEESDVGQSGSLARVTSLLDNAKAALIEKLNATRGKADDDIESLNSQLDSVIIWSNARKCYRDYVFVDIDKATGKGSACVNISEEVFNGNIPVVTCALQGFVSKLNLDKSNSVPSSYPLQVYRDDNQDIAVAVDCEPLANKVLVEAFDQSRWNGDSFTGVSVEIRACSYSNQAPAQY